MKTKIISIAGKLLRGLLFSILLFFRPFATGLLGLVAGLCMIGFIGTLILDRSQVTALFGMFSFGVAAAGLAFGYNFLIVMLAPSGFTMMMEE